MKDINILDCTMRDGGYINNWLFGRNTIQNIIISMIEANTDLIEVGFLRNCQYDENCTCFNNINDIKKILPNDSGNSEFVAMILYTDYDIDKLEICDGTVQHIRVTFHNYDIIEGLEYCRRVKEKGYRIFINPINLMGYSDMELIELLEKVNEIEPFGFSIVDTFGSMTKSDLIRIYAICENNLGKDIVLGIHLHENMAMGYSLAQNFLDMKSPTRKCVIDGSLYGMGRQPGNLCIELIMDYLNKNYNSMYQLDCLLDAIENYIMPIKKKVGWGYSTEYFLSAKYNLHRSYAEFYQNKGRLTAKAMNHILEQISLDKKGVFDRKYAEAMYQKYMDFSIDDRENMARLRAEFKGKTVLLIAPGKSLKDYFAIIEQYSLKSEIVSISANFYIPDLKCKYVFFSNLKRYDEYKKILHMQALIVTSNILREEKIDGVTVDYRSLSLLENAYSDSCGILLLRLIAQLEVKDILMVGFDGFSQNGENYMEGHFGEFVKGYKDNNKKIAEEILKVKQRIPIYFLSESVYERYL